MHKAIRTGSPTNRLILVLGGARSGKSAYAQDLAGKLAAGSGGDVLYVATAQAGDEEMMARIAAHRLSRPANWETLETPRQVGAAILNLASTARVVLVDCLTLLASNAVLSLPEPVTVESAEAVVVEEAEGLLAAYQAGTADWIVVSNEVGLGLVPPYPLGRSYRDALGRANQRLATVAGEVVFMVAGLPLHLKGNNHFDLNTRRTGSTKQSGKPPIER
jgi:adenosylcobinamide kinase/adenosylcobinamide-phosphate guanylyltransferase